MNSMGEDGDPTSNFSLPTYSSPYASFKPAHCGFPDRVTLLEASDCRERDRIQIQTTPCHHKSSVYALDRRKMGRTPRPVPEVSLESDGSIQTDGTVQPIVHLCTSLHTQSRRCLVRWATQAWYQNVIIAEEDRMAEACNTLQMAFRVCLAHRELAVRRDIFKMQKRRKREALAAEDQQKYQGAVSIQKTYRKWTQRVEFSVLKARHSSAICMQKLARCSLSTKRLQFLKERKAFSESAAVIQNNVRAHGRALLLRKIHAVGIMAKRSDSTILSRNHSDTRLGKWGSVYSVQRQWKEHSLAAKKRQRDELKLALSRAKATVSIQSRARLFVAKRKHQQLIRNQMMVQEQAEAAALKIQCTYRRHSAATMRANLCRANERARIIRRMKKQDVLMPNLVRMKQPGAGTAESLVEIDLGQTKRRIVRAFRKMTLSNAKQARCAVRVQAVFRGHVVRLRLLLRSRRRKALPRPIPGCHRKKAVTTMQKTYRGHRERRILRKKSESCAITLVQKIYRGFSHRQHIYRLQQKEGARLRIYRFLSHYMGLWSDNQQHKRKVERSEPAINIQIHIRVVLARRASFKLNCVERFGAEERNSTERTMHLCFERTMSKLVILRNRSGIMRNMFSQWASSPHKLDNFSLVKMLKDGAPYLFRRKTNLSTTVDLLFAKKCNGSRKHVTFTEFIELLHEFNAIVFPRVLECRGHSGKDAKMLHLMFNHVFASNEQLYNVLLSSCHSFLVTNATKVQCLYRTSIAKQHVLLRQQQIRGQKQAEATIRHCTKIQCTCRRFLSRMKAISLALKRYQKFIDPDKKPYYSISYQGDNVTWVKPAIFGKHADCTRTSSLPGRGREYCVSCSLCREEIAVSNCLSCHESLCHACIESSHSKGMRKLHELVPIPVCSDCGYQHGSRLCFVCSSDRCSTASYCDTCFHNFHKDKHEHNNAFWLVVPCVECHQFAARWRCEACMDYYCPVCFHLLHKKGARRNHSAERLVVHFTTVIRMHREAWGNANDKTEHQQVEEIAKEEVTRRRNVQSAVKIQSAWRRHTGRRIGKEVMKKMRRKEREAWRRRKEDELSKQKRQWRWRLRNYIEKAKRRVHP